MKRLRAVTLILVVGMISIAATVMKATPTVQLDTYSGVYPGLGGGEFTAYTSVNYLGNYASSATYDGGFETFCVETGVEFSPGTTYYYSLGYISQPVPPTGEGSAVYLTEGAAWLYYQFASGNLDNLENGIFDYTYGTQRESDDDSLQAAIWAFQGNQSYNGYPSGTVDNAFYNLAVNALGLANAESDYNGSSVEILQMWTGQDETSDEAAQNQLVLTGNSWNVPDAACTAGLLGVGLFAIIFFQLRRAKTT